MKVGELKKLLSNFDDAKEVTITDGFEGRCYSGKFSVQEIEILDYNKESFIDIGIGGCLE